MLTAINKYREMILLPRLTLNEILSLRGQDFFCPECRGPLIIKAGEIKMPHFAHKSGTMCNVSHEPETFQHMKGKLHLFQHFSSFIPQVTLEHYLTEIQQRPDIYIQLNNRNFALEYQCSPISSTAFAERTAGYQNAGIEPVWISGEKVKTKGPGTIVLSNFQQNFIRFSPHAGYWFAFFDGLSQKMNLYFNLSPLSTTIFTSTIQSLPLASIPFPFLLPLKEFNSNQAQRFLESKKTWIINKQKYNRGVNDPFLTSLYLNRDHIQKLPDFIGLATEHMLLFKNHPIEWQYYIWGDVFKKKEEGSTVILEEIKKNMDMRVEKGFIRYRNMPLIKEDLRLQAIEEYLLVLEKRDIIKKVRGDEYLLLHAHIK
ncbi:competence protein CoiA [Bacillus salacetis]|uniref:competence protein CoiA n=1 Tax=Bacillus salacetis TaxID=2315464 RepID=UPI003BA39727